MLKKLLFAATITIALHMFLGVNTSSQIQVQPISQPNNSEPTMTTASEIQTPDRTSINADSWQ